MSETREANWTAYEQASFNPGYEAQIDLHAKPGSPEQWRHRKRVHTGQEVPPWEWGQPPASPT